jgi:hypothetical protein
MTRALEGSRAAPALTSPTTETRGNGGVPKNGRVAEISARTIYRDFLIELEENARGWRVVRIAHCLADAKAFRPPASTTAIAWLPKTVVEH